ncbi:YheC/YheD family protein [Paenibacillus sp. LHD-38]|uniref:YheC/YheD family protein n=1 Tax=Paenibacillus sp. LHD-38 TaxID=3072143 RepID=UPI00280DA94F|nr:YheC/YheD family protein [Paenibacillus sp. LHD-38]MDQ8736228.1 YheC/YheD family protein [Paenibacillus sp. LHD-38]
MSYRSTSIKSKWVKTKWLLKNANIRKYVPYTLLFNRSNLSIMLSRYSTVYFKPTGGTGGFNINRIKKLGNGYQVQHNAKKNRYATLDALYGQLKKRAKGGSYLLQKGIQLATANGRPFDIRVMVQKSNNGVWKSTAIFTKVGMPGKVATNYHQGGDLGYFNKTLSKAGFSKTSSERKEKDLKKLGKSVGQIFDKHSSGFRELGLDVALDNKGNAWILEVNTRPQFYPLKHMKDKSMYRSIMAYAKQYGRKK